MSLTLHNNEDDSHCGTDGFSMHIVDEKYIREEVVNWRVTMIEWKVCVGGGGG